MVGNLTLQICVINLEPVSLQLLTDHADRAAQSLLTDQVDNVTHSLLTDRVDWVWFFDLIQSCSGAAIWWIVLN